MNIKLPTSPPVGFVCTHSLHLATLLGTLGCKPLTIKRGPERTPQGTEKVTWVFEACPISEEVIERWNNIQPSKQWERMTDDEKVMVIDTVNAFASNLRHFVAHTKQRT